MPMRNAPAPGMFPNQNMRPNFPAAQVPPHGGAPNNPLAFLESISKTTNNLDPRWRSDHNLNNYRFFDDFKDPKDFNLMKWRFLIIYFIAFE